MFIGGHGIGVSFGLSKHPQDMFIKRGHIADSHPTARPATLRGGKHRGPVRQPTGSRERTQSSRDVGILGSPAGRICSKLHNPVKGAASPLVMVASNAVSPLLALATLRGGLIVENDI